MSDVEISHSLLRRLAERTAVELPDDRMVFFGFRGALPIELGGTAFAAGHRIRLVDYNHQLMRCTIGQWRPASGTVALFPGSTVPNLRAMTTARAAGGSGANMLMLGHFKYRKGIHKAATPRGHRAFRQAIFFPVWRSADDLDYDANDRLDLGASAASFVFDNLHCAFHDNIDTPGYSSNGCQVVAGLPMAAYRGNRPETGPWRRFIENAYGAEAPGQDGFHYLLFSGAETALVAGRPDEALTRSLRFGSSGEWVERLQTALRSEGYDFLQVDGDFGRDTLQAVMAFQRRDLGPTSADGVVGPNTAAALGIAWPTLSGGPVPAPPAAPPPPAPPVVAAAGHGAVPAEWQASATAITPGFEVSGDPYEGVSGDFDGMGISCGALQWNIGKGSLQPMVKAVGQATVVRLMPQLGAVMWRACNGSIGEGLRIVRTWQNGSRLSQTARSELRALMGSPAMRAEQDGRIGQVADRALRQAGQWATASGQSAPTKRDFLWFFDLVTQNGSLGEIGRDDVDQFKASNGSGNSDDVICNFLAAQTGSSGHARDAQRNAQLWRNQAQPEQLDLLVLSYLRSGTALPKWRHVVLNRKGSIAMGGGWVNGTKYDFSSHGI